MKKIHKSEEEWRKILTSEQYAVMRKKGTESAFSCGWKNRGDGTYCCAACKLPLFEEKSKFESETGWPSYFSPVNYEHVIEHLDNSLGMHRTEVLCTRCESHLGHVFPDGPPPTGKRYCINSLALNFQKDEKEK